jgi:hypothetical protein
MRFLGKSKIGKQHSKPTITYPIIRLPLQCSDSIGTSVQIYKSEHAGQTVFVIIPDDEKSGSLKQEVAQPNAKVVQPTSENNIEFHLSTLESSISDIKELLFQNLNNLTSNHQTTSKSRAEGGIRTRVVASTGP